MSGERGVFFRPESAIRGVFQAWVRAWTYAHLGLEGAIVHQPYVSWNFHGHLFH